MKRFIVLLLLVAFTCHAQGLQRVDDRGETNGCLRSDLPRQIQIEAQFVAFDLTNIAKMAAVNGISTASLIALWTNGFGELLASQVVITKAGQEAVVKGVTEFIYPTTFAVTSISNLNSSAVALPTGAVVEPGGFQTRETGIILQVVPELSPDDGQIINMTLNPQIVEEPTWEDYGHISQDGARSWRLSMKQPFFHIYCASSAISVYNGQRMLLGGGMQSRDKKRMVYIFIAARLLTLDGQYIAPRERER